jgi:hypothetical protein
LPGIQRQRLNRLVDFHKIRYRDPSQPCVQYV